MSRSPLTPCHIFIGSIVGSYLTLLCMDYHDPKWKSVAILTPLQAKWAFSVNKMLWTIWGLILTQLSEFQVARHVCRFKVLNALDMCACYPLCNILQFLMHGVETVGNICVIVHGLCCIMPIMFSFPSTFHCTSCLVWWFTARRDLFSCMFWWKMKTRWSGICPSGYQFWYSSTTAVALPFQNPITKCIL